MAPDNAYKIILDLCGGSGSWSKPYKRAGYDVRVFDIKTGSDIRLLEEIPDVYGILAAPPCTVFSLAGNRWKRTEKEILEALSVVDACLRIVFACKPKFWALENPVGKLSKYLGPPRFVFDPCDFGDAYTKRTMLWGNFNFPKLRPVVPVPTTKGDHSQDLFLTSVLKKNLTHRNRAALRAITPQAFAKAFMEANR